MTPNDTTHLDTHQMLTFGPLEPHYDAAVALGIGDIKSDAKGTAARYNGGKPDYSLLPLSVYSDYQYFLFRHHKSIGMGQLEDRARGCLAQLGGYQATHSHGCLMMAIIALGAPWDDACRVFAYGLGKYAPWNWAKGMPWSVPLASATRHLNAMIAGEINDPESGLPHAGHVMCNIIMLLTYIEHYPEGNDLPVVFLSEEALA